jgi:hypothetical protein
MNNNINAVYKIPFDKGMSMHSTKGHFILHLERFIVGFSVLTTTTVNSNRLGRDAISLVQNLKTLGKGSV